MNILGAGGHAKVIIDILHENRVLISGVWDDNTLLGDICGYKINGTISTFSDDKEKTIIAIGNNKIRQKLAQHFNTLKFGIAIHPKSFVSKNTEIGNGTVIMANSSVNISSKIGNHVIINTNSSIDHDCTIDDFVHIAPNVALAGNVSIGEGAQVGIGATIIQDIHIGKWAIIGAGSVIINNVPDYAKVVGVPGKIITYIENNK